MRSTLGALLLALATGIAVAAGWIAMGARREQASLEARLATLEDEVRGLEAAQEAPPRDATLVGLDIPRTARGAAPVPGGGTVSPRVHEGAGPLSTPADSTEAEAAEREELEALVAEAVERKAAEIRTLQTNKKPHVDLFAQTLALTEDQRYRAERAIVDTQREIRGILEVPTAQGANLMDELVEGIAYGMAHPKEAAGRGMQIFGRILTEQIPGTSETYAERIESVKARLRETFRQDWSETQYATFEAWQMDPTEVQGIEGSPWKEVEARVLERARQLGAEIPADR